MKYHIRLCVSCASLPRPLLLSVSRSCQYKLDRQHLHRVSLCGNFDLEYTVNYNNIWLNTWMLVLGRSAIIFSFSTDEMCILFSWWRHLLWLCLICANILSLPRNACCSALHPISLCKHTCRSILCSWSEVNAFGCSNRRNSLENFQNNFLDGADPPNSQSCIHCRGWGSDWE